MGMFARSDIMSVAIPEGDGGCGSAHSRPVTKGVADKVWNIESQCYTCASALRNMGYHDPGPDSNDHKLLKGDPMWSTSVEGVPETPDELREREGAEKRSHLANESAQVRAFEDISSALLQLAHVSAGNQEALTKLTELSQVLAKGQTSAKPPATRSRAAAPKA